MQIKEYNDSFLNKIPITFFLLHLTDILLTLGAYIIDSSLFFAHEGNPLVHFLISNRFWGQLSFFAIISLFFFYWGNKLAVESIKNSKILSYLFSGVYIITIYIYLTNAHIGWINYIMQGI